MNTEEKIQTFYKSYNWFKKRFKELQDNVLKEVPEINRCLFYTNMIIEIDDIDDFSFRIRMFHDFINVTWSPIINDDNTVFCKITFSKSPVDNESLPPLWSLFLNRAGGLDEVINSQCPKYVMSIDGSVYQLILHLLDKYIEQFKFGK